MNDKIISINDNDNFNDNNNVHDDSANENKDDKTITKYNMQQFNKSKYGTIKYVW